MEFSKLVCCCIVLVVCCMSQLVCGLSCYLCTTTTSGGGCDDDFDAYAGGISTTTESCDYCYKQKTLFGGRTFISRGCTSGNEDDMKCWESDYQMGHWWQTQEYHICYCDNDFCNGGNRVFCHTAAVLSVVSTVALTLIKHML